MSTSTKVVSYEGKINSKIRLIFFPEHNKIKTFFEGEQKEDIKVKEGYTEKDFYQYCERLKLKYKE